MTLTSADEAIKVGCGGCGGARCDAMVVQVLVAHACCHRARSGSGGACTVVNTQCMHVEACSALHSQTAHIPMRNTENKAVNRMSVHFRGGMLARSSRRCVYEGWGDGQSEQMVGKLMEIKLNFRSHQHNQSATLSWRCLLSVTCPDGFNEHTSLVHALLGKERGAPHRRCGCSNP